MLSATLLGGQFLAEPAAAEVPSITEQRLVLLGINAMSRAAEMKLFGRWSPWCRDDLSALPARRKPMGRCNCNKNSPAFGCKLVHFKAVSTIPRRDPDSHGSEKIGAVLAESGYELREVGHNVIFAMLAIKAFRLMPQVATPQRVEGVCNLIRSFKPWRDTGPDGTVQPPPFADQAATSRYTLTEASAAIDRFMGYGQGFAGHMLTFGQALVELAAMGDVELVEQSRTAFCQFVTVTRKGPAAESRKIPAPPSQIRPNDPSYW